MNGAADSEAIQPAERASMEPAPEAPAAEQPAPRTPTWAEKVVRWLDDGVRVPGTGIRFGLDPIIGFLLPGAGDAVTGVGSASLLFLALKERVPTVAIFRMVMNIAIDVLVGTIPIVGDLFDAAWKSNRKNLDLIERYRTDPKAKPTPADYVLSGLGVGLIALSIALPFIVFGLLGVGLFDLLSGD